MGFNSCYHLSDVVSFVSGRHLVIFDPHCTALPAVSAADPGKRIDFVASRVGDENPDQFAPYQVRIAHERPCCLYACSAVRHLHGMMDRQCPDVMP